MKRGLPVVEMSEDVETSKQKIKTPQKRKKTSKKSYTTEKTIPIKPWERRPLIPVKGNEREIKRGEAIRHAAEPIDDDKKDYQLPGIKGINKGFQINVPIPEEEPSTGCCGKKKAKSVSDVQVGKKSSPKISITPISSDVTPEPEYYYRRTTSKSSTHLNASTSGISKPISASINKHKIETRASMKDEAALDVKTSNISNCSVVIKVPVEINNDKK